MPAHDHLNERLFHGTTAWLKAGDVIEPRTRDDFYGPDATDGRGYRYPVDEHTAIGAYATPDVGVAKKFAKQRMDTEARAAGVDTKFARQGSDWVHIPVFRGDAPYQPALFSPVYEVEHLSEHSDPHGRITAKGHSHRRDKVGFRVVGNPVAYANYDDKAWGDL